jgi:hypothetical protein
MNAVHDPLAQGRAQFFQPKPEGDTDLVGEVRNLLIGAGLLQQVALHFDTHEHVMGAVGKESSVQRHLLNRYWNLQLSMCPNNMDVRFYLVPNGKISDWLRLFSESVLPFVVQNQLPRAIMVPVNDGI